MSSMVRKIQRSIAKENIQKMDISIFKKYAPRTVKRLNKRTGKTEDHDEMHSYFSRTWRNWAYDKFYGVRRRKA